MFWTFLLATTLAASFVKLGATAAMVGVLSLALKCAVLAIAVLTFALLGEQVRKHTLGAKSPRYALATCSFVLGTRRR